MNKLQPQISARHHHPMSPLYLILKPRSRKLKSVLCLVLILLIQIFFLSIHSTASQNFRLIPMINSSIDRDKISYYDHLIDIFQQQDFISEPFEVKSKLYFDALYKFNPDWNISPLLNLRYHKKLAQEKDFSLYYKRECEREWDKLNVDDKDERKNICSVVRSSILKSWKQNKHIENEIFNYIGHLKIYNQLYILQQLPYPSHFKNFESKLFPMFTGVLPIFKNYNDEQFKNQLPHVEIESNFESADSYHGENMIQYLSQNYKGRGIVFTSSDRHVEDLIRVINVLRFLQNELPIEIIFKNGELSKESQDVILSAARDDNEDLPLKQKIWFVDVTPCIDLQYVKFFNGYSMKFLLSIFSSFNEMIFIDNDAIPFIKPDFFFELSSYQDTRGLFFKDRNFKNNGLNQQVLDFYKKLLPSIQFDTKFFQIDSVRDESILRNNFFKGLSKHFIDSGVFLMDKKTHLGGILTSLHLSSWVPTSTFVYGDKELFWLGQLMVGNKISFSTNFASASGQLQKYSEISTSNKICSSKLTHLSNDGSILWINGGLNYCNERNVNVDDLKLSSYKGKFNDLNALKNFYSQDFTIDSVIIPSLNLNEFPNSDNEPIKNWEFEPNLGCNNRFFCAFDSFGPLNKSIKSKVIQFDQDEKNLYRDIISVWSK